MPNIVTTDAAFRRERYGISNNHDVVLTRDLGNEWIVWVLVLALACHACTNRVTEVTVRPLLLSSMT